MAYFLQISSTNKTAKNTTDKIIIEIKTPHVFFEIAHDVILQLNIDVCRQPARPPLPPQRVWLRH